MGSSSPELSLDFKPTYIPKTIGLFLREISKIGNVTNRLSKVDDYVKKLEEEMNKIDAFKRELPLCMLLLNDAIGVLKKEAMQCVVSDVPSVIEESLPLTMKFDKDVRVEKEIDTRDMKNWMSSAQLWTNNLDEKQKSEEIAEEDDRTATKNRFLPCKYPNGEGAFLSFKGFPDFSVSRKEDKVVQPSSGLSLLTHGITFPSVDPSCCLFNSKNSGDSRAGTVSLTTNIESNSQILTQSQQLSKKQRRCWSPDLHRRFLSALQELGGSQAATPKQIRELMKVDGLTNDEVKSHLQKYRLHSRRISASSSSPAVVGGLWMHQDQCGVSKSANSQSESPQGPLQLTGAGGGISTTYGDSIEEDDDEDDGKSEGYSWRSHFCKSSQDEA